MKTYGFDEYIESLNRIGSDSVGIVTKAVHNGAGILADEIRKNLESNLQGSETSTGDLEESLGIAPVRVDADGVINTRIGFDGYDREGVPNVIKARVMESGRKLRAMESGTSKTPKRPFIRPAIKAAENRIIHEMDETIRDEIDKIM